MKILHRFVTYLELVPYTLEDIVEKAQKTNEKEVVITAIVKKYSDMKEEDSLGKYQPVAIIGKKLMNVGKPIYVDFRPADCEGINLRHKIIEGRQGEVEKILFDYVKKLRNCKINVRFQNFNRNY